MRMPLQHVDHILRIASAHKNLNDAGDPVLPAGWMNTKSEQALVKKGLIHHWKEVRPLGGGGAIGLLKVEWSFCDLTDEGWRICAELTDKTDEK